MASHGVPRAAGTAVRTADQRREELQKIDKYLKLVDQVDSKAAERQYSSELLNLTSKLLSQNPEYYSVWNIRRRVLLELFAESDNNTTQTPQAQDPLAGTDPASETLSFIKDDLTFVVPLLKKWPKCYWIWDHRIWLLQQATAKLATQTARRLWQEELALCSMMLVRDNRNFHGWGYRRMIVAHLESPDLEGRSLAEDEFAYTARLVHANMSNFSAWHARSKLIPRVLAEREASDEERRKFLEDEFDMMRNALWTDAADQSLWFYHQWLMTTLLDPSAFGTICPHFSQEERIRWVTTQTLDLRDMLDGADEPEWIYKALIGCVLGLGRLAGQLPDEDRKDLKIWLAELRNVDPLRRGRWDDLERRLAL